MPGIHCSRHLIIKTTKQKRKARETFRVDFLTVLIISIIREIGNAPLKIGVLAI